MLAEGDEKVASEVRPTEDGEVKLVDNKTRFVIDTGALIHIINDAKLLSNKSYAPIIIHSVNKAGVYRERGDVIASDKLILHDVLLVPDFSRNLISWKHLTMVEF